MAITVRRGITVPLAGAPAQEIGETTAVSRVALVGADHPGMRAELLVAEGESVARGAPLYRDRRRPSILYTAPVAGRVHEIAIGARRRLSALVLAAEGDESARFEVSGAGTRAGVVELLLGSGLWPALRTRPFDRVPDPQGAPDALFVTAIDTEPHAPDPRVVLRAEGEAFARGAKALALLTEGPVFVCQGAGAPLLAEEGNLRVAAFSGPHPAGLLSTHLGALFPLGKGRTVWHLSYQDVIAFGKLLETGEVEGTRVIALAGQGVRAPGLARVPMGADLHALMRGRAGGGGHRVLSGSPLSGRESQYLGRYHLQASVVPRPAEKRANWLISALGRAAAPAPLIPTQALEQAMAPGIAVVPLLRALSVGDSETAQRLGALALAEEDMALATYVTGGETDFSAKLRAVLETLEEEA